MPENARNTDPTEPDATVEVTETTAAEPEETAAEGPTREPVGEPAPDEPVAAVASDQPAPEEPADREPAAEEPTAAVASDQPAADEPVPGFAAEELAPEEPVAAVANDQPAAQQPAPEEPASESAAELTAGDQPVPREPTSEPAPAEPVAAVAGDQPAAQQPAPEEPAVESAAELTAGDQPVPREPSSEPAPEEPVAAVASDQPAAQQPAPEEPAVEPATELTAGDQPVPREPTSEQVTAAAEAPAAEAPAAEAPEAPEPVEEPEDIKALRAAKESGERLEGKVIGWNRGGFHVALEGGITAFCPNSEMELGRPRSPETYVDRVLGFGVIKVQRRGRRVVLSREAVLKEERERLLAELRDHAGVVLKGTVTSITDFGVFVDLGGLEGLVHVSELSRRRVGHPKNAVSLGQEVEVKVLKLEQDGERISLSMKALEPDPWRGVAERYPAGSQFTGKIARKTDFGLFVELEPEIDGLVHVSRLPHGADLDDPSLAIGETVTGWVQEVEPKRQRVSLSLREIAKNDPWRSIDERLSEGAVVEGTVESAMPFGVFINLQPGLTGLLPTVEMGIPKGTNPARLYSPGQRVTVQVASIDKRRKRISLAREGSKVEGSRADFQAYRKRQQEDAAKGLSQLAHAFAKLRDEGEDGEEGAPE